MKVYSSRPEIFMYMGHFYLKRLGYGLCQADTTTCSYGYKIKVFCRALKEPVTHATPYHEDGDVQIIGQCTNAVQYICMRKPVQMLHI